MAIDIRDIELTEEQKRRVAELAEKTGRPWKEILDEQISSPLEAEPTKRFRKYKDTYIHDPEKRRAYFQQWLAQQTSHNPNFDDSRESIYFGRE